MNSEQKINNNINVKPQIKDIKFENNWGSLSAFVWQIGNHRLFSNVSRAAANRWKCWLSSLLSSVKYQCLKWNLTDGKCITIWYKPVYLIGIILLWLRVTLLLICRVRRIPGELDQYYPWLIIFCLLSPLDHQQPWYQLYKISRPLSCNDISIT